MSTPQTNPDPYRRPGGEPFDVVLVKKGVNPLDAKTEDFKRVSVVAGSPTEASQHADVSAAEKEGEGFLFVQAVNPSALTEYEMMARSREHQGSMGGAIDRTKI